MSVYKFMPAMVFSLFSINSIAIASPYLSGQVGTFGAGEGVDSGDYGRAGRLAGGYSWGVTKRIKLGLETGVTFFEKTHCSTIYQTVSIWYLSPDKPYTIAGEVQRVNFDLLGVFDFFVTKRFDLYIKAGEGYQQRKFESLSAKPAFSSTTTNAPGFKMALGLGYDVTKNININLECAYQNGKNEYFVNKSTPSFGTTLLGIKYSFTKKE